MCVRLECPAVAALEKDSNQHGFSVFRPTGTAIKVPVAISISIARLQRGFSAATYHGVQ